MSGIRGPESTPEIARGLSQVVSQALADDAPVGALEAACHLAQLLSMSGLERLLGALETRAAAGWPPALRPVIDQVRRAADACGREASIEPLRRMDEELGLVARAIERVPRSPEPPVAPASGPRPAAGSTPVLLAEALAGLPVQRAHQEVLQRTRLHPSVAGALRAALDWLLGDSEPQLRMWLASDGSALEVTCESVVYANVHAASEVLTNVGAHLGPAGERPGAWTVRVPILAERETFLMVEQDELQLAVPWHAVARVRLMPADTIDAMARRQGLPVLAPIAAAPRRAAEQPVVVVALGLKRACLVADRLVWRMSAEPADPAEAPPATGISRAVRSDEGDLYWVLDPAWLLRGVAAPALAEPRRPRPATPPAPEPEPIAPPPPIPFTLHAMRSAPAEAPEAIEAAEPEGTAEPFPRQDEPIHALSPSDVEPMRLVEREAHEPPSPEAPPPATIDEAPAPAPPTAPPPPERRAPAVAQALVAEDSITARVFLVRLLEQRGLAVHAVGTAAELRSLLPHGPWALVCADIDLPDARGEAFLSEVTQRAADARSPLVALVRDAADESVARAAGAVATLRKPYERDALDRLLARLVPGLPARPAPGGADPREWGAR